GEWKIISKTANSVSSKKSGESILFVVSNADFYGNSEIKTGNSFSEIVDAYHTYLEGGYNVDFVSPEGGAVPLAYINTSIARQKKYLYDPDFMYGLKNTLTPDEVDPKQYRAIYYVGGSAAMYGVPENLAIQNIAMRIYEEQQGIISSICHGTAGIVNLKTKDGKYLVDGKKISGYPEAYERQKEEYFKQFPFLIQKTIEERGGIFKVAPRGKAHMEAQDNVITGQNHLSVEMVAQKVIETLQKQKLK
ncbi:MAG: type 1 glutamine amidotransferase domain-containing protein, partial [Bacteroidota bacterium]